MGSKSSRAVVLTAAVLLAAFVAAPIGRPGAQGPEIGQVRAIGGNVNVIHPDGMLVVVNPAALRAGAAARGTLPLIENNVVRTGIDGRAIIDLKGQISIGMRENTALTLVSRWERGRGATRIIRLERGEIWLTVPSATSAMEIETPAVVAVMIDADADVRVGEDGETVVTVTRNGVELLTRYGTCHVRASMHSRIARNGPCSPPSVVDASSVVAWARELGVAPALPAPVPPVVSPPPVPSPTPRRPDTPRPPAPAPPVAGVAQAEMVAVAAGDFWMGSTPDEVAQAVATCVGGGRDRDACREEFQHEAPRRRVNLDAFQIDRVEVTNAAYARFVAATKRAPPTIGDDALASATQPVVGVTWHDADAYCRWAGKRLPTEAEWEKAARGPDGRRYPWGNEWDPARANAMGVVGRSTEGGSYPAGASPYGAQDMAGNAWEWVADWYAPYPDRPAVVRNPQGPNNGYDKVLRGGSWNDSSIVVRTTTRLLYRPEAQDSNVGFRCARPGG